MFQSLRGFGVGWSGEGHRGPGDRGSVSIPERVWGGLELFNVAILPKR